MLNLNDKPAIDPAHIVGADASAAAPALVSIRGIGKTYQEGKVEVHAVNGVDLDVGQGEMLAICGPSGSGKSTLLNIIGLLDDPSRGEISISGRTLATLSPKERAVLRTDFIGFIFQSFNLVPVLTALENVLLPLDLQGKRTAADVDRAKGLLAAVGLSAQADSRPDRMSGGQRQRVAIARAMINRPKLVIADEPTANLDSETSAKVMQLISELHRDSGVTFVFSTHDDRILHHMTRIVKLRDGVIEQGAH